VSAGTVLRGVVSAVELVAFHLLLPWDTVRLVADVLGVWGLLWMLGFTAGFAVHPHLATAGGLRVRHGVSTDVLVPWEAIDSVGSRLRSREKSRAVQLDRAEGGTTLNVVITAQTDVELVLRHPLRVQLPGGEEVVTRLHLFADDARGLAAHVRRQLTPTGGR
jgi:hypothetical protein